MPHQTQSKNPNCQNNIVSNVSNVHYNKSVLQKRNNDNPLVCALLILIIIFFISFAIISKNNRVRQEESLQQKQPEINKINQFEALKNITYSKNAQSINNKNSEAKDCRETNPALDSSQSFCEELNKILEESGVYSSEDMNNLKIKLQPLLPKCNLNIIEPLFTIHKTEAHVYKKYTKLFRFVYYVKTDNEIYVKSITKTKFF